MTRGAQGGKQRFSPYRLKKTKDGREESYHHTTKTIYCPGCLQSFGGVDAEQRYREHYKDKHSKPSNRATTVIVHNSADFWKQPCKICKAPRDKCCC